MAIVALDVASYDHFIESNDRVVVHFWAEWNAYCDGEMRARLAELNNSYGNLIAFASFDASLEQHLEKCRLVRVMNLPALALYRSGQHLATIVGLGELQRTVSGLEKLLTAD